MYIRYFILLIVIVLTIFTPSWFVGDFIADVQYLMISSLVVNIFSYHLSDKNNFEKLLSFFISTNCLIYFLTTVDVISSDVGGEFVAYRLALIFGFDTKFDVSIGKIIEVFNFIQIMLCIISLALVLMLFSSQFFKKKRAKK